MRTFLLFTFLGLLSLSSEAQEYRLSLKLANSSFVRGEAVVVQMELQNLGRELIRGGVGRGSDRFFVEVASGEDFRESPLLTDAPFSKPFRLEPGRKHICKVQLDKWYNLLKEGKYFAKLVLIHNEMRYESAVKAFEVVPGIKVLEGVQMFVNEQKLKRIFTIVHWNRNRTERLFLRIEDEPNGSVWDTIDLGMHLKTSKPKLDIAANGEVTVVHKSSQDSFNRTVIWSLPKSLEIAERDSLLDPEVSASARVRSLYGDAVEDGPVNPEANKSWWKFW